MRKKKLSAAVRKSGRGRGGRKAGAWTLVSPDGLRGWRETNKGHAVATTKMQQRLADLMKGPAPTGTRPSRGGSTAPATNGTVHSVNGDSTLIQATASIVVEAIRAGGKRSVSATELGLLVRTVRDALA